MLDTITVVGLGVTGKSFFVYAQKFSAGLCIFPLQSSALLFCHTQLRVAVKQLPYVNKIEIEDDTMIIYSKEDVSAQISHMVIELGSPLYEIQKKNFGLDEIYHRYFEGRESDEVKHL